MDIRAESQGRHLEVRTGREVIEMMLTVLVPIASLYNPRATYPGVAIPTMDQASIPLNH